MRQEVMELDFANGLLFALGLSYSGSHVIYKTEPCFGLLRQVIGYLFDQLAVCFPFSIVQ